MTRRIAAPYGGEPDLPRERFVWAYMPWGWDRMCSLCQQADVHEHAETGEIICCSGACDDSEVACPECGMVGCDCYT